MNSNEQLYYEFNDEQNISNFGDEYYEVINPDNMFNMSRLSENLLEKKMDQLFVLPQELLLEFCDGKRLFEGWEIEASTQFLWFPVRPYKIVCVEELRSCWYSGGFYYTMIESDFDD